MPWHYTCSALHLMGSCLWACVLHAKQHYLQTIKDENINYIIEVKV